MRRKVLIGLVLMSLAVGILSVVPNVSGVEDVAMVIDIEGIETKVNDLYIYHAWVSRYGLPGHETKRSLEIRKGETELTIPFTNIREMEFEWGEGQSTVTISTVSGERIKGMPQCSGRTFKGETDYGYFELSMYETKKVIFSHEIAPISPTPTSVATTTTPTVTPTPLTTTPIPTLTPASSPDETMPPCEKGYKDCYPPWGDCETNIYEDNDNCGDCGNQCPEGYFCLLGSCVENTAANKEKLATYFMEQYRAYDEGRRYEDVKNYLLKAKDLYIDINRPDQVLEVNALIEEIEEKIFEREIFELVFEVAIAVILAVFFGYLFESKTKKVPLWVVVASSAAVFFTVFLVLRLWIFPIFS